MKCHSLLTRPNVFTIVTFAHKVMGLYNKKQLTVAVPVRITKMRCGKNPRFDKEDIMFSGIKEYLTVVVRVGGIRRRDRTIRNDHTCTHAKLPNVTRGWASEPLKILITSFVISNLEVFVVAVLMVTLPK
jgi:hypothetical protein